MKKNYKHDKKLTRLARSVRNNQTDAEKLLWKYLRNRQLNGFKFRRQYPASNYIIDFYCDEKRLAVELDGSQHEERESYDNKRNMQLNNQGIKVVRFWDNEVFNNTEGVFGRDIKDSRPHPNPLLKGEGAIWFSLFYNITICEGFSLF